MRRALTALILTVLVLVIATAPAMADPPGPTNYRSEVVSVEPSGSVEATIRGGDSFLEVRVEPGVAVDVPGYEGEPYIRIDVAGDVYVNEASPAFWLNQDRYAQSTVPDSVGVDAAPDWVQHGQGGVYAWHDHRIHWMSPDLPPQIDETEAGEVYEWTVPFSVSGVVGQITGVLEYEPSVSPIPWLLIAVAAAVPFVFIRRRPVAAGLWLIVGSVSGLIVGVAQVVETPAGAGGVVGAIAGPAVGLVGGVVGAVLEQRRRGAGRYPILIGAVGLAVWAVTRLDVFTMPVLGTGLAPPVERILVAVALGASVACAVAVVLGIATPNRDDPDRGPDRHDT